MAVQIPRIQRLEVQPAPSAGRIETPVPDGRQAFASTVNALGGLLETVDKVEEQTSDLEAIRVANNFEKWYRTQLDGDSAAGIVGVRHMEGDPTDIYNKLDQDSAGKRKELLDGLSGFNDATKQKAQKLLLNKENSLFNIRLTAYGEQQSRYEQRITDESVGLSKISAADAAGFVIPGDDTSLAFFEKSLADITEQRVKRGLSVGTASDDPAGEFGILQSDGTERRVKLTDTVKLEVKKDISEATYNAIDALLKSEQVEKAKFMIDKYAVQLDPVRRAKIMEDYEKANVEFQAYNALSKMEQEGLSPKQQFAKAAGLPIKIKQKALELLDSNERYKTNIKSRDEKEVFNTLATMVLNKESKGEGFVDRTALEQSKEYKQLIGRVSAKQRQALWEMVEKPKNSDPDAVERNLGFIANDQYYGMSEAVLMENLAGLSDSDRNFFRGQWTKAKTDTESQERSRAAYVSKVLSTSMETAKLIKKDQFGNYDKKSQKYRNEAIAEVLNDFDKFPKNMSIPDIQKQVETIVADKVKSKEREKRGLITELWESLPFSKRKEDQSRSAPVVQPDVTKSLSPKSASSPEQKPYNSLTPQEQIKVLEEYKKENGKAPGKGELIKWYRNRGK